MFCVPQVDLWYTEQRRAYREVSGLGADVARRREDRALVHVHFRRQLAENIFKVQVLKNAVPVGHRAVLMSCDAYDRDDN